MDNIDFTKKYYWKADKPVLLNNMFLAEDFNKYNVVDYLVEEINKISSNIDVVFSGLNNIEYALIDKTTDMFPPDSYILTINYTKGNNIKGISTINIMSTIFSGTFHAQYLPVGTTLVESLNGRTGDIQNVLTGILINGELKSGSDVVLGTFFTKDENLVYSINSGKGGPQWVIKTIKINGTNYSTLDAQYHITIPDNFFNTVFKHNLSLEKATVPTEAEDNSIVNVEMFNLIYRVSAAIEKDAPKTINNVIDWICITDLNHSVILPTQANLMNNTLTLTSPSAGVVYYYSNILV